MAKPTLGIAYGWKAWNTLGEPADPMENVRRYRAQSILTGIDMADGGPAPILPAWQARDVVAWAERNEGWQL